MTEVVSQEKLISACEEALNHLLSTLIPSLGDDFFAIEKRTQRHKFTCQGLQFDFGQSSLSTNTRHSYLGFSLDFLHWQGAEKTRQLNIWVEHPQAERTANRRAVETATRFLIDKVKNKNALQVTVDGRSFVEG